MLLALRLALYVQFFMGIGRFFGIITNERVWDLHFGLGVLIAVLALLALRPNPALANPGPRQVARFMPLLPLALGLGMTFNLVGGFGPVVTHMALGLATVGVVEAAAGRERRGLAENAASKPAPGSPES